MMINPQSGLIRTVIIIIIAVLILSYFGFDLKAFMDSPLTQKNIGYLKAGASFVWDNYLKRPITYFWNEIFIELLWKSFLTNLNRVKSGEPMDIERWSPKVNF